jgi:hypothetical protein
MKQRKLLSLKQAPLLVFQNKRRQVSRFGAGTRMHSGSGSTMAEHCGSGGSGSTTLVRTQKHNTVFLKINSSACTVPPNTSRQYLSNISSNFCTVWPYRPVKVPGVPVHEHLHIGMVQQTPQNYRMYHYLGTGTDTKVGR